MHRLLSPRLSLRTKVAPPCDHVVEGGRSNAAAFRPIGIRYTEIWAPQ